MPQEPCTTTKGVIGELKTIMKIISDGWIVYTPIADVDGCDLIAERDGILRHVQVRYHTKTGTKSSTSITIWVDPKQVNADFIAVPIEKPELGINEVVFIPYNGEKSFAIAFEKAKNNQEKGRRWYKDYLDLY